MAVEEHQCVWEYSWRESKTKCSGHTVEDCKAKWANVTTALKTKSGQGAENIQPHWTAMQFYNRYSALQRSTKSSSAVSTLKCIWTQQLLLIVALSHNNHVTTSRQLSLLKRCATIYDNKIYEIWGNQCNINNIWPNSENLWIKILWEHTTYPYPKKYLNKIYMYVFLIICSEIWKRQWAIFNFNTWKLVPLVFKQLRLNG